MIYVTTMHFVKFDKIIVIERCRDLVIKFNYKFSDFRLNHIFSFQNFELQILEGCRIILRTGKQALRMLF